LLQLNKQKQIRAIIRSLSGYHVLPKPASCMTTVLSTHQLLRALSAMVKICCTSWFNHCITL